jgi:AcrR family transcriptional regulator
MSKYSQLATRIPEGPKELPMTSTEPRKSPSQDRARATVTAILDATARILAEDGFTAVNTNRVAEVAGVSVGSLYQYFPNKAALVGAVAVRHTETMAAIVAAGVHAAADDDPPGLVKTLIRATMAAHAEHPKLRRAIIEELPRIGRPARIAELKQDIHRSVVALLTARRSRIKVKDIPMAAFVIVNTVEHLTHVAQTAGYGARELGRLERELHDLILAYLLGRRT